MPHISLVTQKIAYQRQVDDDGEDLEQDLFEKGIDCGTFTQSAEDFSRLFLDVKVERQRVDVFKCSGGEFTVRVLLLDKRQWRALVQLESTCMSGLHLRHPCCPA